MDQKQAVRILNKLEELYPNPHIMLNFSNPLEMLVATILSAQSTDAQINKLTPALFEKYKTAEDYANCDIGELERYTHSSGFYRNKAKNIRAAANMIMHDFNGKVPDTMEDLMKLPGVARKTANIVLSNAFGIVEGIAVDTHVARLSQRLGFTKNTNPDKIEQDLLKLIPKKDWYKINYLLIDHGRAICNARKPKCQDCAVRKMCPSASKFLADYYNK